MSKKQKNLQDIVRLSRSDIDNVANATIRRLVEMFAKAIAPVINIIDPDIIVIGGGVGNIEEIYIQTDKYIERFLFNDKLQTKIVKPKLGDSAGVFGAAFLVLD